MNRNHHRIVFNAARGQLMAVSETATAFTGSAAAGDGPASTKKRWRRAGAALLTALATLPSQAQISADPTAAGNLRPTVLTAPNAVPLVNIQTPSAAGVSRNVYQQFDVGTQGAILNNSRTNVQTQLGGWVQGNPWLATGPARVILNEVNSSQPSRLNGFVEVGGQRAEVVIANPAGISVNGGGFINASRATLTTGKPVMNGGNLESYRVQRGVISIFGDGLNATLTDHTGVLARAIEVNAGLWANNLKLITGANDISADQGSTAQASVSANAASAQGPVPSFALDVAQIGGMYAGHIHLIGTEAGLGVRNHGTLGASAGDVHIDANGWLSSAGRIEAARGGVHIQSAQAQTHTGSVLAAGNLNLHSGKQGARTAVENSGAMRAGLETHIRASELSNAGQIDAQRLDVAVATLNNSGAIWQSGAQALEVNTAALNNAQGAAIGAVQASGAAPAPAPPPATDSSPAPSPGPAPAPSTSPAPAPVTVPVPATLANGLISVTGTLNNSGAATLAAAGDLNLNTTETLINAGNVRAQGVVARGQLLENSMGALQAATLDVHTTAVRLNGGAVAANTATLITSEHSQAQGAQLYTQGALRVQTERLTNAGELQSASTARLDVDQTLSNTGTVAAAGNLTITAGALSSSGNLVAGVNNDGTLQPFAVGAPALSVTTVGELVATGKNLAAGDMALRGAGVDVGNSQSSAHSATITSTGSIDTRSSTVVSATGLSLEAAGALDNGAGQLSAKGGDLRITATGVNNRDGLLVASGELSANARTAAVDNTGGDILALGKLSLSTTADIRNTAGLIQSDADVVLDAAGINNSQGQVLAGRDLDIAASNTLNNAGGTLYAQRALTVQDRAPTSAAATASTTTPAQRTLAIVNTGGEIVANSAATPTTSTVAITAKTIGLDGTMHSGGHMGLDLVGDLATAAGQQVRAGGDLGVQLHGGNFSNAGQWQAGKSLGIRADNIDNQASGELLSLAATTLDTSQNSTGTVTNRGLIDGADTRIRSHLVDNVGSGRIYGDRIAMAAHILSNREESLNGLTRAATIAARERLDIGAQHITNHEGALIFSAGDMAIGGALDADLHAVTDGSANAQTLNNNSATIESLGAMTLVADTLRNTNEHLVVADVEQTPAEHIVEYQGHNAGSGARFRQGTPGVSVGWQTMPTSGSVLYILDTPEYSGFGGGFDNPWTEYNYTRRTFVTTVTETAPARLVAGGNLRIHGQSLLNDASHILAGGQLSFSQAGLNNTAVDGQEVEVDTGEAILYWRVKRSGKDRTGSASSPISETRTRTFELVVDRVEDNTSPAGTGVTIGALASTGAINTTSPGNGSSAASTLASLPGQAPAAAVGNAASTAPSQSAPSLLVPGSSLFKVTPGSSARYLVETDPRFANHRQWLSSDHMLQALAIDPATTQKRLGDGFYEQKLIREQVASLTGYRFLGDFRSDEQQYMALMTAGATFAKAHQLRPGIALSAAQVAQLTSDIVWLVTRSVTLPDGSTTNALVPQVYLRPRTGDLDSNGALFAAGHTGALISAQDVALTLRGDLDNSGTILGRRLVRMDVVNLDNTGQILGHAVQLSAEEDINITGGEVRAVAGMALNAGGDLNVITTTQSSSSQAGGNRFSQQGVDRVAGLYVSGQAGVLLASAGGDVNLIGAQLQNEGSGLTLIQVDGSVKMGTVQTGRSQDIRWSAKNSLSQSNSEEVGTRVAGGGAVDIRAQHGVSLRAAQVDATGALSMAAIQGSVRIETGQSEQSLVEAHQFKGRGFLSKQTNTFGRQHDSTQAQTSEIGGQSVSIASGQDVRIAGSSVIADQDLSINAARNVTIEAAQNTSAKSSFNETKKSGLLASGAGITLGKQQQSTGAQSSTTTAAASTVGSVGGDVSVKAGQTYTQVGSDVLAPGGSITVQAQSIAITEARTTERRASEQRFKQSGLSVGLSNPVIDTLHGVANTAEALGNTGDARTQALGLAVAALQGKQLYDAAQAIASNPAAAAGIGINISLGSSKSQSKSAVVHEGAHGSNVVAGGDVTLSAQGAGSASDLRVQGSTIDAGNTARLLAEGDIELTAAIKSTRETNSQSSRSGSIGVGFSAGGAQSGVSFSAGASRGKGQGAGEELTHVNTQVRAGQRVVVESGKDTTLRGAVVTAPNVQARIGGDLLIESLQDRVTYSEQSKSASAGVSVCMPPLCYGASSISGGVGQTDIDSSYASVRDQSAIRAGDGSFDVTTQGKTTLVGGAITSTQAAVDSGANRFDSRGGLELIDIQNQASYEADGYSVNASFSTELGDESTAKTVEQKKAAAAPTGPGGSAGIGSDQGSASSVTSAAISGIAGDTQARTGDAGTGIAPIFERERVKDEVNAQIAITAEFGKQASKAVGDFAGKKFEELKQSDPEEAAKWAEGGVYRSMAHAVVGGLTGGAGGALGAGAAALSADALNQLTQDMPAGVRNVVGAAVAAGIGAAAGGGSGAAAALNADTNNRQLHPSEIRWIKDNAKRYAEKEGVSVDEAEKRLAQQAFRQVQFGVEGKTDVSAQAFLKQAGSQLLPGDSSALGQNVGYMFYATPAQKANPGMYAQALVSDPQALAFYAKQGLVQPSTANLLAAAQKDSKVRDALGIATTGAGALALGVTMPAAASWCLTNPVACNRVLITGGEIAAGDALGPTGLAIGGASAAAAGLRSMKSADEANAIMKAAGKEPAWSPGTAVIGAELKPGTKVQMVVTEEQYLEFMKPLPPGQTPRLPIGNWATFDDVASQAQARQSLAITPGFKPDVNYVFEYEVVKPIGADIGFVGQQTTNSGALLRGGGTQMEFDWKRVPNRGEYLKPVGPPIALPVLVQ